MADLRRQLKKSLPTLTGNTKFPVCIASRDGQPVNLLYNNCLPVIFAHRPQLISGTSHSTWLKIPSTKATFRSVFSVYGECGSPTRFASSGKPPDEANLQSPPLHTAFQQSMSSHSWESKDRNDFLGQRYFPPVLPSSPPCHKSLFGNNASEGSHNFGTTPSLAKSGTVGHIPRMREHSLTSYHRVLGKYTLFDLVSFSRSVYGASVCEIVQFSDNRT